MGRTAVNVAGQALVALIVAKRKGILNEDLYKALRTYRCAGPASC